VSLDKDAVLKPLYVPAGDGESVWAFAGDRYTVKASAPDTGGAASVLEALIPPGSGPPLHVHRGEDEAFYLLQGELEMATGETTFVATPGSFVFVPTGAPHTFRNCGGDMAKLLFLLAPGGFERFFLEVGTPVSESSSPPPPEQYAADVDHAMRVANKYGMYAV